MPRSRVNHRAAWLPEPAIGNVCLSNEPYTSDRLPRALRHSRVRSFEPWDRTCAHCGAGRQGASRNRSSRDGQRQARCQSPPTTKRACLPLPPEAHAAQTIQLDGKTLHYTVTVGALPVRDSDGKVAGEVVVTAFTMEGANRPVTFAFNGGPGAASVYLNFGAIGPKHVDAGNEGAQPFRSRQPRRQPRHMARFHRPRLHRSHRHRLQPLQGG